MEMERETGIEPATPSLGNRTSVENKNYSVFGDSDVRSRLHCFRPFASTVSELEQNWSKMLYARP